MSHKLPRSLTPISKQLATDSLRIDAVLDSFVVPAANVWAVPPLSGPASVKQISDASGDSRQNGADRKKQNIARRARRS